jgi:WD40 repeat protein
MDADLKLELARVPVASRIGWWPVAAISPDLRQLAFFSQDGISGIDEQLEVWDLVSKLPVAVRQPHLGSGGGLSFGPDGRSLAATYENMLIVYETVQFSSTFNMGGSFENSFGGTIGGSAGFLAMPVSQEFAVRLIQPQSGREVANLKLPGVPFSQCFSQDGSVLLVTHSQGSRIIHLKVDREKLRLEGHQGGVPAVEFSPNGKQLATVGKDRTLRLWDLAAPGESTILGQLPAPGQAIAYTPDGEFLVCGYYDMGELSIWSTGTRKLVRTIKASAEHAGPTWACAISPDGQRLAAIGGNGLRLWDLPSLTLSGSASSFADNPLISETNGICDVMFDPVGKQLAYAYLTPARNVLGIQIRGIASEDRPQIVATNRQNNFVQGQCFLPNSGAFAYADTNREVTVVEPATGRIILKFPTLDPGDNSKWDLSNLRACPDGSKLAMVTTSGLGVDLREPATGKLLYTLPDEPGSIWWLAWSPDSQRLAVSRANGDIAIWNLKEVEAQLLPLDLKP